jgi:hypothetical protein
MAVETTHIVERLSREAPLAEAGLLVVTEGYHLGDEFVVQRRVGWPLRWDACLIQVTPWGPHLVKTGFGLTRRLARRSMRRDPQPFRMTIPPASSTPEEA